MATLAIKASPHVSWRRTVRGGVIAGGVFVLLVAGYMTLRALGIGPAGSLLAAGKLTASDKVLVAAFDAPGADSSLGSTIAEAVRTNLSQSQAVRVMPSSAVVAALEQMKRPDTARVDFTTAREIAQRTGAKAVVAGSVVPAGGGYIVTARLVAAESGDELASYRESAKDAGDLIPAVDRLTKSLRGKIGESLSAVRAAPRLDQVTTGSLDALKNYAAGLHANDIQGDYPAAIQYFRDAIAKDSNFAMAYVQLAYSILTAGGPGSQARADSALTAGFRLRDRLPERERYNVEGAYYANVAPDRSKAITAFRRAVQLDSQNYDAANSLGVILNDARQFSEAERAYRLALAGMPGNGTIMANVAMQYMQQGRHAAFDTVIAEIAKVGSFPTATLRFQELWNRREYDTAEQLAKVQVDTASPGAAMQARYALGNVTMLRGRLREAERVFGQADEAFQRIRGVSPSPYTGAFLRSLEAAAIRGDVAAARAQLDAVVREHPLVGDAAVQDGGLRLAQGYARAGETARARELISQYEKALDSLGRRRDYSWIARTHGLISLAEGQADSAKLWFRRGDNDADGLPTRSCTVCTQFFLGSAFDRAGQADSARVYLTKYVNDPGTDRIIVDRIFLGPVLYRLGELYEGAGDTKQATEYYGRFVDLWRNADSDLQPRVTEARARMARLTSR
jgi:tetratricopeptide (TPR) repeat protein